jgi:hypothetical protein
MDRQAQWLRAIMVGAPKITGIEKGNMILTDGWLAQKKRGALWLMRHDRLYTPISFDEVVPQLARDNKVDKDMSPFRRFSEPLFT